MKRMEFELYKWKYIFDGIGFDIIPNEQLDKPKILYKFYSLNQYSLDSLTKQYVYATHPSQLNDLFDCNEQLLDFDDIETIQYFLKGTPFEFKIIELLKDNPDALKVFVQRNFKEKMYRKWGVLSMTSEPNNILLWSYYTNHNGFCIEFDISKFPFKFYGPFPINYQNDIKALPIKQFGAQIGTLVQCNIKDEIWKHENEWRLMIPAPIGQEMASPHFEFLKSLCGHNRKFNYPIDAIQSIALGNRFFDPEEIHEISKVQLEIKIKRNKEKKASILDFLSKYQIKVHLGLRSGFTKIVFRSIKIEKLQKHKYRINALPSE